MKLIFNQLLMLSAFAPLLAAQTAHADQVKADNNSTSLDLGGAWVSGTAPVGTNWAIWEGTYTPANCTNALAANAIWGGIDIGNVTGAPIDITTANSSVLTLNGLPTDTIDMSAATVDITVGCQLYIGNGATNSFTVASGRTFTYAGSSALYFSLATGSAPAILRLDGGGNYIFNGSLDTYVRLSGEENWPVFVMNGTGVCSLNGTGHAMNFMLNSGTLNVNNLYALCGYSGQTVTINGGTIDNTSGSAIDLSGSGNDPLYNWNGDFVYGGTYALGLGSGAVTLGQNVQLTCNGSSTLTVGGAIGDVGSGYSLTKAGAGTLSLTGANTYTGATTINGGTLALGSSASLAAESSVSIAAGATFDVSANASYTLGSGAGLAASGTGTDSSTAAAIKGGSGGTVSLGSRPITLTYNGSQPALYISQGTLVLSGNAFTVNGSALSPGTYTIVEQASGSISSSGSYSASGTAIGSGSGSISVSGGDVILTVTSGGGQSTTTSLSRTTGSSPQTYGSALTFTVIVSGQTTSPSGNVIFKDGSTPLFTNTLTAGTSPDSSASYTSYTALDVNGGTAHSIAAYYQGDGTHDASSSSSSPVSQTITAKALTVSGLTANDKAYDGNTTATLSGTAALLSSETAGSGTTSDGKPYTDDTVSVTGTPTGTFASSSVGNDISVSVSGLSLTGDQAGNYSLTEPTLSADITSGVTGEIVSNQIASTLDLGGAWVSGTAPVGTNWAIWEGTYTPANCTNALAANAIWGGIDIGNVTGAPIDITTANSSVLTLNGLPTDTIDMSAATVDITVGCQLYIGNGATNSFTVASGRTFTYAGSSALYFSLATGSAPAILRLDGGGNYIFNGSLDTYVRLSGEENWPVFVMNGTGVCSLNGTGHAMNFMLNSGTLNVNNLYALCGYSGQTVTINGGTIDNTSGSAIDLSGSGNDPLYNWNGDFVYGGTYALGLGSGAVTLGQNVQLTCNGSSTLTVGGAIGDVGSGYSLTKAGAGTLSLTGANTYTGATTINGGTLALGSSASLAAESSVSIAAGATFDVSANASYTLGSGAGLAASGTGTDSSTAAAIKGGSGGTVSLGSRPITLTYNGSQPALYISQGTLVLSGNAFTVNGSALSPGTYTIVEQASGSISSSGSYSASGTAIGSGSGSISVSGGDVILTVTSGGGQSTTTSLSRTTGSSPQTYGSALTFTVIVSGQTTSPSGNVIFKDGSTPLFTNTLTAGTSPDSSASYTSYTALDVNGGTAHSIAAYYQGDGTHDASSSSSSPVSQTITAKALTVSGLTANDKAYDGNTTATLSGTAALLSSETAGSGTTSDGKPYTDDTVSVTGTPTGTFASSSVGNDISVSVSGLSLTGDQAGNYSLTEPTLSADITSGVTGEIVSNQIASTLDLGGAWVSGTAPVGTNWAIWEGTYTPANCTNALAANAIWGGIDIGNVTGAPIDITTANSSVLTLNGLPTDTIDMSAATVDITVGCQLYIGNGATNSFTVASGRTFTYAGSSALYFSLATGSAPAILRLDGGGNYIFNGSLDTYVRLSGEENWPVFVMNGTGVCSLNGTGHAMNFMLNSGTLNVNNLYALCGYSGQTVTINGGTIDNTSGSAIDLSGSGNDPLYNWNGDFVYGGTYALGLGSGAVTLGQNVQLTCNGSSTLTVGGAIGDVGSGYSLTKAGAGTLSLTGANTYTGATTINGGTLALGSSASLAAESSVSIAAGATFDVSANASYTLGSGAGLAASGTGTDSSTAAAIKGGSGGTVSLGSRPITLTYNGSQPALYISQGTLVLSGNAFTVNGSALSPGTYTIVEQASGSISSSGSYSASGTAIGSGSGSISVSGGDVILTVTSGGGQSTTTSLSRTTGSSPQTYGSALTFTVIVSGQTTSPSGNVIFKDGSTPLFTNTLTAGTSPDSSASYTSYTALDVNGGTAHSIAAYYQGDGTHDASSSSSSPVSQTITAKALTVSGLTANDKAYDGNTTATLSGTAALLSSETAGSGTTSDGKPYTDDTVSVTGTPTGTFASSSVGNDISVSVSGLSLTGDQAGNYSLTEPTLSADITSGSSLITSLLLTSSSQTNAYTIPVAFGATVLANGVPATDATGDVIFLLNGITFSTNSLVNGTANSIYVSYLSVGTNIITAQYAGDGNYSGCTNTLDQVVIQQTSDVTFSNSLMAITFSPTPMNPYNPNSFITTIIREDTGENKNYNSDGFYIWNEQTSTATYFAQMAEIAPNVMLFSTSDGKYNVAIGVTVENRYMKFSLLNVSDNPSGGIDTNWVGLSVAFQCYPFPFGGQTNDGWQIYCLGLDPMEDVLSTVNPVEALWPYVQYSQTNAYAYPYVNRNDQTTNGYPLQPMGSLAIYSATNAAQHDDVLYDIWGGEPSLPEPNRTHLTNGWDRAAAQAWVTEWLSDLPPTKMLFLVPNSLSDLYSAADIMYASGLNELYLFNAYWEGDTVDAINTNLFSNGLSDLTTFEEYCAARGISLDFHATSAWVSFDDPIYGAMSPTGLSPGLARWATGTLLTSINSGSTSFNVRPDPGYQLLVDPPPWGDYDQGSSVPLADDYPPYYPNWYHPMMNIDNDLMFASVTEVNSTNWLVSGINRSSPTQVSQFGSYWGENHDAGSKVDFLLNFANYNFIPDSRSDLLTNLAVRYATLFNEEHIHEANYDGLEQQQDLGNWGPRRFSQALYEALDHPVHANSSFGSAPWGHFEYNFDSVQKHDGGPGFEVESSEAAPMAQVRLWDPSLMATHLDEDQFCFGLQASYCPNMSIGGYHVGTDVNTITNQGWWSQVVTNLDIWQSLAPYLTTNEQATLRSFGPDFYVPSQSGDGWELTPTRAMLRDGVDMPWQLMTESGPISPHQFMQVGDTLDSLTNPYTAQTPQIEILVLPSMTATNASNVSLLSSSVNFTDQTPHSWSSSAIDMSQSRGVAFTVTGDGSGSVLVLNIGGSGYPPIGGRYYAVTVDFTGTRTFEVPNGEVEWYRFSTPTDGYGYMQSQNIGTFNYTSVGTFTLFLGYVPSGVSPDIQVSAIQTMHEDQTIGLVNPTLTLNGNSVSISGTIPYNDYVVYSGGGTASVYDANWNFVTTLPVSGSTLTAVNGNNTFSVSAPGSPNTWMATRVKVSGTPWVITP